jgi:hypothetical protein
VSRVARAFRARTLRQDEEELVGVDGDGATSVGDDRDEARWPVSID